MKCSTNSIEYKEISTSNSEWRKSLGYRGHEELGDKGVLNLAWLTEISNGKCLVHDCKARHVIYVILFMAVEWNLNRPQKSLVPLFIPQLSQIERLKGLSQGDDPRMVYLTTLAPLSRLGCNVCKPSHSLTGHLKHAQKELHRVEIRGLKPILELCAVKDVGKLYKEVAIEWKGDTPGILDRLLMNRK